MQILFPFFLGLYKELSDLSFLTPSKSTNSPSQPTKQVYSKSRMAQARARGKKKELLSILRDEMKTVEQKILKQTDLLRDKYNMLNKTKGLQIKEVEELLERKTKKKLEDLQRRQEELEVIKLSI